MKIVDDKITVEELKKMAEKMFDNLVKAVVDIEKKVMVVDAMMHADQEALLLDEGSNQENLCPSTRFTRSGCSESIFIQIKQKNKILLNLIR